MKKHIPNITGKTKLTGVMGYPVDHTLSPQMHNTQFEKLKLDFIYVPFSVKPEEVEHAVAGIRALNMVGVNVTVPHKEAVIPYLDDITPLARTLGAVNTIKNEEGVLIGDNTDGYGFEKSVEEDADFHLKDHSLVIIGTGGAGRAIAITAAFSQAIKIILVDVVLEKAQKIIREFTSKPELMALKQPELAALSPNDEALKVVLADCDLIVQATPLGMKPEDPLPISPECLPEGKVVCDIVYVRKTTPFLDLALQKNCRIVHGLGMLVHQGARAFEIWTGQKPDTSLMKQTVATALGF